MIDYLVPEIYICYVIINDYDILYSIDIDRGKKERKNVFFQPRKFLLCHLANIYYDMDKRWLTSMSDVSERKILSSIYSEKIKVLNSTKLD